jgi:hypothetical protein
MIFRGRGISSLDAMAALFSAAVFAADITPASIGEVGHQLRWKFIEKPYPVVRITLDSE